MAITIPEINSVSVVDDTDNIMLTHSNGNSEKISGAAFKSDMIKNKIENNNGHAVSVNAVSTIMATSTTITGPELGTGGNIKILFTSAIAGSDTSTGLSLTYNGNTIAVKVGKDGALEDFCAHEVSTGVYRYLQAYSTLEMTFDGTQFIIVGNPGIYSALVAIEIPVGTIIAQYKKAAPNGYLYLDGSTFNQADYPSLYAYLGNSNVLPDYREYALVGAEMNNTDTIANHDVYTQGQGKDDQLQNHYHSFNGGYGAGSKGTAWLRTDGNNPNTPWYPVGDVTSARAGSVTRGKRKAVFFYIKAVSIADIL